MPISSWINGAQLIPEGKPYKIDSASRIVIPAHLKAKFGLQNTDYMDYYTTFIDGRWFMCVTQHVPTPDEQLEGK